VAKTYLEPEEVERLEDAAAYLRDRLLIRLLFRLGCRVSEALGIAVDDIDFNQDTVTIQHLKARVKLSCPHCDTRLSKTAKFCPGCGQRVEKAVAEEKEHRRQRTLPVDRDTLGMLKEYIDHGGLVSQNGKQLLFGIGRGHARCIIVNLAAKAGLEKLVNPETGKERNISPHRLRDAFAVMAVQHNDSTDSIRMLQEQLGHANIGTTMRYRKVAGQELKEWYSDLWEKGNARTSNGNNQ
jgi:integrase/recombinase XerD